MAQNLIRTSKFLSRVLRHQPGLIGIELSHDGWVNIDTLIEAAVASGKKIDRDLLIRVVNESDKQRFAISEDGDRIRANQGHSVNVDLGLEPQCPPDQLFHGTVERFLGSIRQSGLQRRSRQHVHLSVDRATAEKVGSRRGHPVVLVIDAKTMHAEGVEFYLSQNGVWLTHEVSIDYIAIPGD